MSGSLSPAAAVHILWDEIGRLCMMHDQEATDVIADDAVVRFWRDDGQRDAGSWRATVAGLWDGLVILEREGISEILWLDERPEVLIVPVPGNVALRVAS